MNQYGYGQPQQMYNQQPQNAYGFNTPYVSGINWVQGVEGAVEQDCEKDIYSKKICKLFGKK